MKGQEGTFQDFAGECALFLKAILWDSFMMRNWAFNLACLAAIYVLRDRSPFLYGAMAGVFLCFNLVTGYQHSRKLRRWRRIRRSVLVGFQEFVISFLLSLQTHRFPVKGYDIKDHVDLDEKVGKFLRAQNARFIGALDEYGAFMESIRHYPGLEFRQEESGGFLELLQLSRSKLDRGVVLMAMYFDEDASVLQQLLSLRKMFEYMEKYLSTGLYRNDAGLFLNDVKKVLALSRGFFSEISPEPHENC